MARITGLLMGRDASCLSRFQRLPTVLMTAAATG